jgi:hypothetical protein
MDPPANMLPPLLPCQHAARQPDGSAREDDDTAAACTLH